MNSKHIIQKAKENGISLYELGKRVYGEKRLRNIYRDTVPTKAQERELKKIEDTLDELIREKIK